MSTRKPRKREPSLGSGGSASGGGGEHWGPDPQDVQRHKRRMREAKDAGPLGRFFRIAAVALLAAGALAVFLNFDTLRELRFDSSRLTSLFRGDSAPPAGARPSEEPGTEVVGDSGVAGVGMPSAIGGADAGAEPPAREAPDNAPPPPAAEASRTEEASPAAEASPRASDPAPEALAAAAADAAPTAPALPEPEPERPPPGPETLGFGLNVMSVSEADASAAVLVLRDGGTRGVSPFTWWTTDGTAAAGSDYARLEPRVERFRAGEQNRTIHIPIVGDRAVEGPETFYVHVVAGESKDGAGPIAEIEVIINDDD